MKKQIEERIKVAMKEKDMILLMTLRGIMSKVVEQEKVKGLELTDEDILKVIQKLSKQREDSIEQFKTANRLDLVEKETLELNILKSYLPSIKTLEETSDILNNLILDGFNNVGAIMKELSVYGTSIDKKLVSTLLKTLLV